MKNIKKMSFFKHEKLLAIIPARSGSKRLPHKNTLEFCGKPLISWTIEEALKSRYIDYVIVSSDDNKIFDIANQYPVELHKRPERLAQDETSSIDVIDHVLQTCRKDISHIVLLQPTSPLRTSKHIDQAMEWFYYKNAKAVISVCEVDHPPFWVNTLPEDFNMKDFLQEDLKNKRSQDFQKFYKLNGAIYICCVKKFLEKKTFFLEEDCYAYKMDIKASVDIDTSLDFDFASFLKKER